MLEKMPDMRKEIKIIIDRDIYPDILSKNIGYNETRHPIELPAIYLQYFETGRSGGNLQVPFTVKVGTGG